MACGKTAQRLSDGKSRMVISTLSPAAIPSTPAAAQPAAAQPAAAQKLAAPIEAAGAIKYPAPPPSGLTESIDPQLGIAVLTLRFDNGLADSTIPTTQQLKAYAAAQFSPPPKPHVT